jgi:DNA repair photolyase
MATQEYPLRLFPPDHTHPTTRDVARQVKEGGGANALTEAQRRADEARYQEVRCRSALNRVEGMPFRWTLNPYRGCTHGCHYCFARRYHEQFELGAGDDFASLILVKTNLADVLARELDRPAWTREVVALGTATDPYQPIEGHYRLTRRSLELLSSSRTPVAIVTKGPMVVRDIDVLRSFAQRAACTVCVSVPSTDEDAWRRLEPGTAHPLQRLRAVRLLVDAGIRAGVLMAPIVPGITSHPRLLAETVRAIADHGARFVGANILYLQGGTRTHFLTFLEREYPELVNGYAELYAGGSKHARPGYANQVRALVQVLQERAGLSRRYGPDDEPSPEPAGGGLPTQSSFAWSASDQAERRARQAEDSAGPRKAGRRGA